MNASTLDGQIESKCAKENTNKKEFINELDRADTQNIKKKCGQTKKSFKKKIKEKKTNAGSGWLIERNTQAYVPAHNTETAALLL